MSNWKKYKNGNYWVKINLDDGTKIKYNDEDCLIPEYPESMDITITERCDGGCPFCYQGATPTGKHGNIMEAKFIDTLLPYTEVAIGGNSLDHPDLTNFLRKLKSKDLIPNITVNQRHFMKNQELLEYYRDNKLIYGFGVSLVDPTDEFIETVKKYPNAVIHVVNGIVTKEQLEKLYDHNLKILILGYKTIGRGKDFYSESVENLKREMYNNLPSMINRFEVVSFDNLALEQLNVRRLMSKDKWEEFFMGDDGMHGFDSASMYIDLVNNKFSYNSLQENKFDLMDDVKDMFKFLTEKNLKKLAKTS